jgi:hypothetical protein
MFEIPQTRRMSSQNRPKRAKIEIRKAGPGHLPVSHQERKSTARKNFDLFLIYLLYIVYVYSTLSMSVLYIVYVYSTLSLVKAMLESVSALELLRSFARPCDAEMLQHLNCVRTLAGTRGNYHAARRARTGRNAAWAQA